MTESGGAVLVSLQRIGGTLFGAIYGSMASGYVLIGFEDGSCLDTSRAADCWTGDYAIRMVLSAVAVPFQLGCGLFEGYEVATAALTAPIILVSSAGKDTGQADIIALFRIKMTCLGVFVFLLIQCALWPETEQSAVRARHTKILRALAADIETAFSPFVAAGDRPQDFSNGITRFVPKLQALDPPAAPLQSTAPALITASLKQLPSAEREPILWQPPFSRSSHERVLRTLLDAAVICKTLGIESRRESAFSDVPVDVVSSLARVGTTVSVALRASAEAMDGWQSMDEVAAGIITQLGALGALCESEILPQRDAVISIAAANSVGSVDAAEEETDSYPAALISRAGANLWCSSLFYATALSSSLDALGWQLLAILQ